MPGEQDFARFQCKAYFGLIAYIDTGPGRY